MKPATACIAVGLLVAGCAGQATRPPTTEVTRIPTNGDWFCQLAPSGDGWQCVQDEELAENPQPARLPEPPQAPETGPEPLPLPDTGPSVTEPSDDAPPQPSPEEPGPGNEGAMLPAPEPAAEAAPEPEPAAPASTDPDPVAPAPRQQTRIGSPGAETAPAYVRLAYRPEQPVALTDLPDDFYAVQVLAMSRRQQLEAFVRRHGIEGMSAAPVERDGEIYYVLLLGVYETLDLAQRAVADLPAPFSETAPWIRPLGSLQSAILRAERLAAAGSSGAASG